MCQWQRLTTQGKVEIHYQDLWQPVVRDAEFSMFLPDDYMINIATLAVLELVRDTARDAGIPLRFVLLDQYDPDFTSAVLGRFEDAVDISTPPRPRSYVFAARFASQSQRQYAVCTTA